MPFDSKAPRVRRDRLTVVCAWCDAVLAEGGPDVSHGLCDQCASDVAKRVREQRPLAS